MKRIDLIISCLNCGKERKIIPANALETWRLNGGVSWNKGSKGLMPAWNKGLRGEIAGAGKSHLYPSGENHPRWIKDRTKLKKKQERSDVAYKEWRMNVWLRDSFKCRIANESCEGRIEAHHILGWTEYVELRYEINNGITLCHAHHPRKRAEEKRLIPQFRELVSVSNERI